MKKELGAQNSSGNTQKKSPFDNNSDNIDYASFKQNDYVFKYFFKILQQIRKSYSIPENVFKYYLLNDIIEKSSG